MKIKTAKSIFFQSIRFIFYALTIIYSCNSLATIEKYVSRDQASGKTILKIDETITLITPVIAREIVDTLTQQSIHDLIIEDVNFTSQALQTLVDGLASYTQLTTLRLRNNHLEQREARQIARIIETNPRLTVLDLTKNRIGPDGAIDIARSLEPHAELRELILAENELGPAGARAIAPVIARSLELTILDLGANGIDHTGALAINRALAPHTHLRILLLQANNLGIQGAVIISETIERNPELTILNLRSNNIGTKGAKTVAKALGHTLGLIELYMGGNNIGPLGAAAIKKVIERNHNLRLIDLHRNKIGLKAAKSLAKSIQFYRGLIVLDLEENNIGGAEAIKEISEILAGLTNLSLRLGGNDIFADVEFHLATEKQPKRTREVSTPSFPESENSSSISSAPQPIELPPPEQKQQCFAPPSLFEDDLDSANTSYKAPAPPTTPVDELSMSSRTPPTPLYIEEEPEAEEVLPQVPTQGAHPNLTTEDIRQIEELVVAPNLRAATSSTTGKK